MVRKQTLRLVVLSLLLMAGASGALAQDATPEATMEAGPDEITLARPGMMPEGIEYDPARGQLLVGSIGEGTVFTVADDGTLTPLVEDDRIASSVGIEVDEANNRLLVSVTNNGETGAVGIYNLETGEEIAFVDLTSVYPDTPGAFINDVAVDAEGNAYATNSAAGVIYRIDPEGNAEVWLDDPSFKGQFVLNGIAYNEAGNFLVAVRQPGLVKIPLDNPAALTEVAADANLQGGDGIIFLDDSTLIVVAGQQNRVFRLSSDDGFATATVTGEFQTRPEVATTAAVRGDDVYIVYANFNNPAAETYPIQRVTFAELMVTEEGMPTQESMTTEGTTTTTEPVVTEEAG